jgi:hypothetical protein
VSNVNPSLSNTAVRAWALSGMPAPLPAKLPVAGSYSSALPRKVESWSRPPVTITEPSDMSVAVAPWRWVDMDPVAVNLPVPGS